ncbi:MAG: sensor domain-containing diguanylate cyclase [Trueperaceae bacterium]
MPDEATVDRPYPLPTSEADRLAEVARYAIVDTDPEEAFDRFVRIATRVFDTAIGLVTIVGDHHQSFKACYGLDGRGTSREIRFCTHAIANDALLIVPDATADPRFRDNPLVTGSTGVRFYAGAPLRTPSGEVLGTLCVLDWRPRPDFDDRDASLLQELADATMHAIEQRLHGIALAEAHGRERARTAWASDRSAILLRISRHEPLEVVLGDLALPSALHEEEGEAWSYVREGNGWRRYGASGGSRREDEAPDPVRDAFGSDAAVGPVAARTVHGDDPDAPAGEAAVLQPIRGEGAVPIGVLVRFGSMRAFADDDVRIRQEDAAWLAGVALQQAELLERLQRQAFYDGLTGLPNRQLLHDRLEQKLERAERNASGVSLLFLDLDGFKEVNDRFGHATGDRLLVEVAQRLASAVRSEETLARIGGDEFVILIRTDRPDAERIVLGRIEGALAPGFEVGGEAVVVTPSIGVARYPDDATDVVGLLSVADDRMYGVKQERR